MSTHATARRLPWSVEATITLLASFAMLFSGLTGVALSAESVAFDQFCNTGCSGGNWTNGNLGTSNSDYSEGDSVPQRFLLTGLTSFAPVTLTFDYSTSRSSSSVQVAYDYLTSWDVSETLTAADRPIPGAPFSDSATIPPDPVTSVSGWFSGPVLGDAMRQLQVQNGTIDSIVMSHDGNFGTAVSTESTMTVTVTPSAASLGVVFGGHISSSLQWTGQADNPSSPFGSPTKSPTAAGIGGSSYHATFGTAVQAGETLGRGGRDNQLSAGAVTPVVAISVAKSLAAGQDTTVGSGDTVTYKIVASNTGNVAGTVDISDTLSGTGAAIAQITSMTSSGATTCTFAGDSGSCPAVSVPAAGSTTITVVATVDTIGRNEVCGDRTLDNVAEAALDGDGDANNTVSVTIAVPSCGDITLDKVSALAGDDDAGPLPTNSDRLTYAIVLTNSGGQAGLVQVEDLAGPDLTITSLSVEGVPCDGGTTSCWVEVPANGTATVDVTATFEPPAAEVCGDYSRVNDAWISDTDDGSELVVDTTADRVTLSGTVGCNADVSGQKLLVGPAGIDVGNDDDGVVVYEIRVANAGFAPASDVSVGDLAADNPGFASITLHPTQADAEANTNALANPTTVDVPAATVDDPGTASVWARAVADLPAGGEVCEDFTLDNTATIDGDKPAAADQSVAVTVIECLPGADIEKYIRSADGQTWLDADTAGSGPTLILPAVAEYKVEVTNTGNVGLVDVHLFDHEDPEVDEVGAPLPDGEAFELDDCTVNVGTEVEASFEGLLGVGDTLTCVFSSSVLEGPHFDVVTLRACWPLADCFLTQQEYPESALRPRGGISFAGARFAPAAAADVTGAFGLFQVSGFDPAHYVGALAPPPPPPPPPSVLGPSIDLVKQGSSTTAGIGSVVTYRYTVTNNGLVGLTNVTLVDLVDAGSGDVTLAIAEASDGISLAPGDSRSFASSHTVTEADLGQIVNVATATGLAGGSVLSDTDRWAVTVTGAPGIDLVKSADTASATFSDRDPTSSVVTYTYAVTNTGNVTLSGITVVDDVLGPITLATTTLAPGASTTGTAPHVVSRADADAGVIVNVAVASGQDSTGAAVGDTDTAEVFVIEVLPETIDRPDEPEPAPLPEVLPPVLPAPDVAPEVLTGTGIESGALLATSLLVILLGLGLLLIEQGLEVETGNGRRRRKGH